MGFLIELAAKKFWPPARARRKGGLRGEFRRARAFRRSEAEAVSFAQSRFGFCHIIAPIPNFPIFVRPIRPREARKGMETRNRLFGFLIIEYGVP